MSSNTKWDMAGAKVLGTSKVTISTATTTAFDFGTPDDINLAANANYTPGDRVMVILTASTAGTTDSITWVINDAPDSSGSIGTPAAALTSFIQGALAAGTGDDYTVAAVELQPNRPWLQCKVTHTGTTDTMVCHAVVLAVPSNL